MNLAQIWTTWTLVSIHNRRVFITGRNSWRMYHTVLALDNIFFKHLTLYQPKLKKKLESILEL